MSPSPLRFAALAPLLALLALPACSSSGATGGTSGPTPVASYPLDPAVLTKAAVVLGSCVPDDRANGILSSWLTDIVDPASDDGHVRGAAACLATHGGGCAAVQSCLGMKVEIVPGCTEGCAGSVATGCDGDAAFRVDCAKLGQICDRGSCRAASGAACDGGTFVSTCEDYDRPSRCSGGKVALGTRCSDWGAVCLDAPGGSGKACVGTGAACTATGYSTKNVLLDSGLGCEGTQLRACVAGGEALIRCEDVATGLTCQSFGGTSFFCGKAAECDALSMKGKDTCDGDSVVVCDAGKIVRVDCKSLGFTGCNATYGVCTPSPWQG